MNDGTFKFSDCLLKHFVRMDGWLDLCKKRRREVVSSKARRLRYLTFCAVDAIDVLMLDVARVIVKSQAEAFDTVYFFDRTAEHVAETQKSIPGAIGFVGKFIDTVLADDPEMPDEAIIDGDTPGGDQSEPLSAETARENTAAVRDAQRTLSERRAFIGSFPFDIVNLDLEDYLFTPNDPVPGRLVNALRSVFQWVKVHAPLRISGGGLPAKWAVMAVAM